MNQGITAIVSELKSLFASQWSNGMLPHIRYSDFERNYEPSSEKWNCISSSGIKTSGITQPLILYTIIYKIYEDLRTQGDTRSITLIRDALVELKDKIELNLDSFRLRMDQGVIFNIHPWETGTDNSPAYDTEIERLNRQVKGHEYQNIIGKRKDTNSVPEHQRPRDLDYEAYGKLIDALRKNNYQAQNMMNNKICAFKDVFFNALFIDSITCLSNLNNELKLGISIPFDKDTLMQDFEQCFWSKKHNSYLNRDTNGSFVTEKTFHIISPLVIRDGKRKQILFKYLAKHFRNENGLILTTSYNSEKFEPERYWRGPIWPVVNWLIWNGVRYSNEKLANEICKHTLLCISQGHNLAHTAECAKSVICFNHVAEGLTIPSHTQYQHGWLWDSALSLLGWAKIGNRSNTGVIAEYYELKNKLKQTLPPRKAISKAALTLNIPTFDEYYSSKHREGDYPIPLGSDMMSWSAAVFLDMYYSK